MSPNPLIVGIASLSGPPRDMLAKYLKQAYGFACYALAQPLYDALEPIYGISPLDLLGAGARDARYPRAGSATPRELVRFLAAQARSIAGEDILVQRFAARCVARGDWNHADIAITDLHHAHEVEWLRSMGGHVFWLDAPNPRPGPGQEATWLNTLYTRHVHTKADAVFMNFRTRELLEQAADHQLVRMRAMDALNPRTRLPAPPTTISKERIPA